LRGGEKERERARERERERCWKASPAAYADSAFAGVC
jgi:hypothetical protein